MATIYLSSTYEDLQDYRGVVFEAPQETPKLVMSCGVVH